MHRLERGGSILRTLAQTASTVAAELFRQQHPASVAAMATALLDQEEQGAATGGADGGKQEQQHQHGGREREPQQLPQQPPCEEAVVCLPDAASMGSGTRQW